MPGASEATPGTASNALYDLVADLPIGELTELAPGAVRVPPGCLLDLLGIEPTHLGRGACRARMRIGEQHLNQRGIVQGGAVGALADAAAGWAAYAALPEGRFTTVDLNCAFIGRTAEGAVLAAEAVPVHLGRRTLVFDVTVRDPERDPGTPGRGPVARFSCTQLVLSV